MDTINYISNQQLPLHLDFKSLKEEALDYIHKHIGSEWTNFNPSDPGVTILDQFCYALTELGYCTDFSIQDILTDYNGKIEIDNQFYLPYEILTTSPYTINDYKKYLIDGIQNIDNVEILPYSTNAFPFNRVYQVYLYINPAIVNSIERTSICKSAFYYLNKSRNLGEVFNEPIALESKNCWIGGKLELEKEADQYAVLLELQNKIRSYIFSKITQTSYSSLTENGYSTAEIYNGPYLKNGWILTESLINKKNSIHAIDLVPIIESVTGVISISGVQLYQEEKIVTILQSAVNQILSIDIIGSYKNRNLILSCNGKDIPFDTFGPLQVSTNNFEETTNSINNANSVKLPKSNFRDINTYYSIQNTFPEQYGIGTDTIENDSNPVQIAQSRQLKGYLTLFDQILANQFSQLSNISKLFSFKNSVCGAPSDEETFYAVKNKYEQKHLEYPVPYKMFSPSYFYQSLYTVPHIKPLLKNNTTFNYSNSNQSKVELNEKSWFEYQQDPYNPYIFGLMKLMEEENTNLDRRNKLLDHLLARHGESPIVIDLIINDTIYIGDKRKDQLILKSLYLQNIGLLSYNRQKGYDYLGASKIAHTVDGNVDTNLTMVKEKHLSFINDNTSDFIFKSEQINKKEKLNQQDFNNFSAFELKLNLLFGLRNLYLNFIATQLDSPKNYTGEQLNPDVSKTIQQVLWFTEKKHGSLLIESVLLLNHLKFNLEIIKGNQVNYTIYTIENIDFQSVTNLNHTLNTLNQATLDSQLEQGYLLFSDAKYSFETTNATIENQNDYIKTEKSNYCYRTTISSENEKVSIETKIFKKTVLLLFPDFIPLFQTPEFKKRLKQFLKINLAVNVTYECFFLNSQQLEGFIPNYIHWYESLRYKDNSEKPLVIDPVQSTITLVSSLTSILEAQNGRNK
jgi:hypothetical protein